MWVRTHNSGAILVKESVAEELDHLTTVTGGTTCCSLCSMSFSRRWFSGNRSRHSLARTKRRSSHCKWRIKSSPSLRARRDSLITPARSRPTPRSSSRSPASLSIRPARFCTVRHRTRIVVAAGCLVDTSSCSKASTTPGDLRREGTDRHCSSAPCGRAITTCSAGIVFRRCMLTPGRRCS